jgi:hypothetical protein
VHTQTRTGDSQACKSMQRPAKDAPPACHLAASNPGNCCCCTLLAQKLYTGLGAPHAHQVTCPAGWSQGLQKPRVESPPHYYSWRQGRSPQPPSTTNTHTHSHTPGMSTVAAIAPCECAWADSGRAAAQQASASRRQNRTAGVSPTEQNRPALPWHTHMHTHTDAQQPHRQHA